MQVCAIRERARLVVHNSATGDAVKLRITVIVVVVVAVVVVVVKLSAANTMRLVGASLRPLRFTK